MSKLHVADHNSLKWPTTKTNIDTVLLTAALGRHPWTVSWTELARRPRARLPTVHNCRRAECWVTANLRTETAGWIFPGINIGLEDVILSQLTCLLSCHNWYLTPLQGKTEEHDLVQSPKTAPHKSHQINRKNWWQRCPLQWH